jgi:hypothetical protein
MANHGYCQNCWWHKDGVCFMQSVETKDESYCPDYANRDKLNKKGTLDELLAKWEAKGVALNIMRLE